MTGAPEPEEIFERTRAEGRRRLSRPFSELVSTAVAAGVDVVFGVAAFGVVSGLVAARSGPDLAHVAGALAFGVAFVFIVVGRSELFTENFLVPIAGLERTRRSWLKLPVGWGDLVENFFTALAGNMIGGILFVTLNRANQAKGGSRSRPSG